MGLTNSGGMSWKEDRSRQATDSLWQGVVTSTPTAVIRRGQHGARMEVEKGIWQVCGAPQATAVQVSDFTAGHCT